MYLAASNRNTANSYYLHLDLLLLKHVRTYSIDLEAFLDARNSLGFHALLLTFLLGDKVAQLRTSCSHVTTSQGKRDGQEKVLFSLVLSLTGSKMFPWAPKRSPLYPGSETAHLLIPAPLAVKWELLGQVTVVAMSACRQVYQHSGLDPSSERRNTRLRRKEVNKLLVLVGWTVAIGVERSNEIKKN